VAVVRFFRDVDEIADRMEGEIADLLLLARCQAGVEPISRASVSVAEVVTAVWSELAKTASTRGLRLDASLPVDLVVDSDLGKLSILVGNLLRNAVSYAPPQSEIRCVAQDLGRRFRLEVSNAAAPLSPADLGRLAEPFWRADEARSSDEHAGLGLSLVSALGQLLGLDVHFRQDSDGTFHARVEGSMRVSGLPRSEPLRPTGSS
jgi:signal transduction histidine kinase